MPEKNANFIRSVTAPGTLQRSAGRDSESGVALAAALAVPGGKRLDEPDRTQHEEVEPEQRDDRVEAASRNAEHRKPEDERRDACERTEPPVMALPVLGQRRHLEQ